MPAPLAPNESASALALLIRQVRDNMWARMARELADAGHELTFSQYITLKKIATGTVGATELARAADLNPGAMTRLIDKLVARGLVTRVVDPRDRRALQIDLTDLGRTIWSEIDQCGRRVRVRAMTGMSEEEQRQLTRLLEQIRDNLSFPGE
ncbi:MULTISPECIES: MarR family winged helix-turn-helix transcriptional regulator [Luteimonas]|uniref:MarR family winged helix-turn-helix transcriptional regulator n=1 Tax=Luteimonas TaxID=83614 RepID=UPI000C79E484|nr:MULTISPECIES: MarR family transcriptional regulator [Luteimonas]